MNHRGVRSLLWLPAVALMAETLGTIGCTGQTRRYPEPAPTALFDVLVQRQRRVTGLDLETRTETVLSGERVRATVLMLVARDGHLRFEAEVSLKGPVATLVANEERYSFVDLDRAMFETGPACPENIATIVQLPLRPRAIAALLLGDVPLGPEARLVSARWDPQAGAELLELHDPGLGSSENAATKNTQAQHFWVWMKYAVRERTFIVIRVEGAQTGAAPPEDRYRVTYGDFSHSSGFFLPDRIRFARPGQSLEAGVEISVRARRVNPTFTEQAFLLTPPPGFSVHNTICGAAPATDQR